MKNYKNVWVVYVHYKSFFSVIPEETSWEQFDGKKDANKYYESIKTEPGIDNVEEPRLFKYYRIKSN